VSDLRVILGDAALRLSMAGVDSPRLDARLLLAHAMNVRPDSLVGSIAVPADALAEFEAMLARRILREPLAYINGSKEFWSLDFDVGPGVLVPRPETETLVEAVLKCVPQKSAAMDILDLGTGTACLPIAVLSEYPNARAVAVEASAEALTWANRNIDKHGLAARCRLQQGNWEDVPAASADVILSNPPYIRSGDIPTLAPEVRKFEPVSALDGGPDGLDAYRSLAPLIARLLKPDGMALLEIGRGQEAKVSALMEGQNLSIAAIFTDLAGIERCIAVEH
jgi:release factor glutamine methyltransferase